MEEEALAKAGADVFEEVFKRNVENSYGQNYTFLATGSFSLLYSEFSESLVSMYLGPL